MNPAFSQRPAILFAAVALLFSSLYLTQGVAAEPVDRTELETIRSSGIVFINYEGPHARVEASAEIQNIGTGMGSVILSGSTRTGDRGKYSVIHCRGAGSDKLDADIFILGVDAGVDHIRNLRLILQGYLQSSYAYSAADAALLAEYVTIYNAVYRGNWDYFTSRYKDIVLKELSQEKAGLSVRFDEWPGRTQILIPLSVGTSGSLSAVSTTPLTDKKVVDELRKDEGKGIDTRKDMVDLKEREASEAKQTATLEREAIKDEEAKLAQQKKELESQKAQTALDEKKAAEAKTTADQAAATAAQTQKPEDKQAASQAKTQQEKAEQQAASDKAEVAKTEQAVAKQEQKVEEKKDAATAAEQRADQKTAEAKAERQDIAKDQKEIIQAEDSRAASSAPQGTPALLMMSSSSDLSRMVLIDTKTGKELKRSAIDSLRGRSVLILPDRILAIAGQSSGSGAIRLVNLDMKSLEMTKQGADDISAKSLIWTKDSGIYALAVVSGKTYLAVFDKDLNRKAVSSVEVHPWCTPIFSDGLIAVQAPDGSAVFLNQGDLVQKK